MAVKASDTDRVPLNDTVPPRAYFLSQRFAISVSVFQSPDACHDHVHGASYLKIERKNTIVSENTDIEQHAQRIRDREHSG